MNDYIKQYTYILNGIASTSTYELDQLLNEAGVSYQDLPLKNKALVAHYIASVRLFGSGYNPMDGFVYDVTNDVMIPAIIGEYVITKGYVKGSYEMENDVVGLLWQVQELTDNLSSISMYDTNASSYPALTSALESLNATRKTSIDYMDAWDDYSKQRKDEPNAPQSNELDMDEDMKEAADAMRDYNLDKSKYTNCRIIGSRQIVLDYYNQMPWGYLHPDYNIAINIDSIRYPSTTNALYASILFTQVDKRIIANTGNALLATFKAEKLFTNHIDTLMAQSAFNYYRAALLAGARVDSYALKTVDEYTAFAPSIRRGGDMLEKEFGRLEGDYANVLYIQSDIDGYLFNNVFDYIDFKVRELFNADGDSLAEVQNAYLESKINTACINIVNTRLLEDTHFARLMATLGSIRVYTHGYLKSYIDPIYTDALADVIRNEQARIEPYTIVDARNYDALIEPWYEDRTREVISMLAVFEKQLAYKLDPYHIEQIIGHVYACTATDEDILFQFYTRRFFELVQDRWKVLFNRRATHFIIYEIWKYICSLVFYVDRFSIPGAPLTDFIEQSRSQIKPRYSREEVSASIDNANQILDSLFNKIPADVNANQRLALLSGLFYPNAPVPSNLSQLKLKLSGRNNGRHALSIVNLFS